MTAVRARVGRARLELEPAFSPWARARGLLGRDGLEPGRALWLRPCGSIHMIGMRFPIDVIWLDRGNRVLRMDRDVPPGIRGFRSCPGARSALELAAGGADGIAPGDELVIDVSAAEREE
ncbi:MAG: DUF192 domain-containing protein [Bacillota bacterium]|nr:DUF192 domain-containing protein [Bacillota bacterium]